VHWEVLKGIEQAIFSREVFYVVVVSEDTKGGHKEADKNVVQRQHGLLVKTWTVDMFLHPNPASVTL
jgi:hypothetical protein